MKFTNFLLSILVFISFVGCLEKKEEIREVPPSDEVGIDYSESKDPVALFVQLDQTLTQWHSSLAKGEYHFVMALEQDLKKLVQGNFTILVNALKDSSVDNKIIAAGSLGFSEDVRAVAPLLKALSDSDELVRSNAAMSLGQLGLKEIPLNPLAQVMEKDPHPDVRAMASYSIAQIVRQSHDKSIFPSLINAIRDSDIRVRNNAVIALGEMQIGEGAKPIFTYTLKDDHPKVRMNSAIALGKIRSPKSVGPLLESLKDENPEVRVAAHWALKEITGEKFDQDPEKWEAWFERQSEFKEEEKSPQK